MKYLVLLIGDGELPNWNTMTPDEQAAVMQQFEQFDAACRERDGVKIEADNPDQELKVGMPADAIIEAGE